LAAIVILVLFEPMRQKVEEYIHRAFFRERVDLERAVQSARRQLVHVLEVRELTQVVMSALEESRRATGAALYLRDPLGSNFDLGFSFGPAAPPRIDDASARPLLERLGSHASVVLEELRENVAERRKREAGTGSGEDERLLAAAEVLGPLKDGVCLAIRSQGTSLVGVLIVKDDRVSDAFSPDEVALLEMLAVQIGVVLENSEQYRRMQERDRLAALGQMAAGLAHEVKNPLGAIKGAAQLLSEPEDGELDPSSREFVGIILEEVERLDRVVRSVLEYARPAKGNPGAVDVNGIVKRTLQVLASARDGATSVEAELADDLPFVRADAEQLRQVLMNLVQNALQATNDAGKVRLFTRKRRGAADLVEIAVQDDGPGITPQVLKSLFVPFFTTKERGTGLGLAISQRMVEEMGGRIEVATQPGAGSTFTVVLPADSPVAVTRPSSPADEPSGSRAPRAAPAPAGDRSPKPA
jgi:signal transduction histidine kinase